LFGVDLLFLAVRELVSGEGLDGSNQVALLRVGQHVLTLDAVFDVFVIECLVEVGLL